MESSYFINLIFGGDLCKVELKLNNTYIGGCAVDKVCGFEWKHINFEGNDHVGRILNMIMYVRKKMAKIVRQVSSHIILEKLVKN